MTSTVAAVVVAAAGGRVRSTCALAAGTVVGTAHVPAGTCGVLIGTTDSRLLRSCVCRVAHSHPEYATLSCENKKFNYFLTNYVVTNVKLLLSKIIKKKFNYSLT